MRRAGVFIGVDQTGNLRKLNDAAASAERMYKWALRQGIEATLISDANGNVVRPDHICDVIKGILDDPPVDQLIVYYAGHGVSFNRSEFWLLTEAPERTNAAVNVAGSVDAARRCGAKHVVFISDACRVPPTGMQDLNVKGSEIFPNVLVPGRGQPVDQFYGCLLGMPAVEIKNLQASSANYKALYTEILLDAVDGSPSSLLTPSTVQGDPFSYVRARPLEEHLEKEVPARVLQLGLQSKVNQEPEALITSDNGWISRLTPHEDGQLISPEPEPLPPTQAEETEQQKIRKASDEIVNSILEGGDKQPRADLSKLRSHILGKVDAIQKPISPDHFKTGCGVKIRGGGVLRCFHLDTDIIGPDLIGIHLQRKLAATLILEFDGGFCSAIPVMDGFIATITFERGQLVNIAYEPVAESPRYYLFKERAAKIRRLRGVAAAASQMGRFRLDGKSAKDLAVEMQNSKAVDPTLSLYAAYAYYDLQEIERIADMSGYLQQDIGITLFDLALLGGQLSRQEVLPNRLLPMFPLFSQGWSLLNSQRVRLHPALKGIEGKMQSSLWTLFNVTALPQLKEALSTGEMP